MSQMLVEHRPLKVITLRYTLLRMRNFKPIKVGVRSKLSEPCKRGEENENYRIQHQRYCRYSTYSSYFFAYCSRFKLVVLYFYLIYGSQGFAGKCSFNLCKRLQLQHCFSWFQGKTKHFFVKY